MNKRPTMMCLAKKRKNKLRLVLWETVTCVVIIKITNEKSNS